MNKRLILAVLVFSLLIFVSGRGVVLAEEEEVIEGLDLDIEDLEFMEIEEILDLELDFDFENIIENIELEELKEKIKKRGFSLEELEKLEEKFSDEYGEKIKEIFEDMEIEKFKELRDRPLEERIFVRGEILEYDEPPMIKDGRTLLPLRAVSEALDADVEWDGENQTVKVEKDEKEVELEIGSNIVYVNGEQKEIDVPALIEKERTLVPLRFVGEILGFEIDYNELTGEISID